MKQEDVRRHAQNLTESLKLNPTTQTGDSEVEAAVCKIIEAILPRLEGGQDKEQLLQNLGQLTEWIDKMPQSLHPESRWNRDEFNAVLSGPVDQQDEKFDDYMDAFYEEYQGTDDQKINEFYDHLFQNERQVSEVNWISLWDSVHTSYENWLESEKLEDDWIRAERAEQPDNQQLGQFADWVSNLPQSLYPKDRWSRDEFHAVLAGPVEQHDAKFDDYMNEFYEEYKDTDDQKINEFYDRLFQNERQISEVNWISLWESVRTSYENWLESEKLEDDWIRAERAANAASKS